MSVWLFFFVAVAFSVYLIFMDLFIGSEEIQLDEFSIFINKSENAFYDDTLHVDSIYRDAWKTRTNSNVIISFSIWTVLMHYYFITLLYKWGTQVSCSPVLLRSFGDSWKRRKLVCIMIDRWTIELNVYLLVVRLIHRPLKTTWRVIHISGMSYEAIVNNCQAN